MSIKHKIAGKINRAISRTHWFNEEMFADCRKFWEYNKFNTDVINLGSTSGCHAFDYEGLPISGGNLALRHNPLSGDLAILKNYFGYLNPNNSHVIITLCAFSSLAGSYDFMEDRFYTLIYPSSIPHFSYRRQQQIKNMVASPIRFFPLWSVKSEIKTLLAKNRHCEKTEKDMKQDADRWIHAWMHEFSLNDFSQPLSLINQDGLKDASSILNEMISFCKERNIKPVLVLPPMYHTLASKFDKNARKLLLDDLLGSLDDKSVTFLNYMDDPCFSHDITLFQDSFLLNKKGAKKFTYTVLKELNIL